MSKFFIINDADCPDAKHVVVKCVDGKGRYPAISNYIFTDLTSATPLEDFGFEIRVGVEGAWFSKVRESKAIYSNGKPRRWQGANVFSILWSKSWIPAYLLDYTNCKPPRTVDDIVKDIAYANIQREESRSQFNEAQIMLDNAIFNRKECDDRLDLLVTELIILMQGLLMPFKLIFCPYCLALVPGSEVAIDLTKVIHCKECGQDFKPKPVEE